MKENAIPNFDVGNMRAEQLRFIDIPVELQKQLAMIVDKFGKFGLNYHVETNGRPHYDPVLVLTVDSTEPIKFLKSIGINLDDYIFPNPVIFYIRDVKWIIKWIKDHVVQKGSDIDLVNEAISLRQSLRGAAEATKIEIYKRLDEIKSLLD